MKKKSIGISVFGYENKEKHLIYVSKKCCEGKHVNLLLIDKYGKRHYVLTKEFNRFMYNHTLHRRKKDYSRYSLPAVSTEEILKFHIKDNFKINGKQKIMMPKKSEYVRFKNYERKIKSPFIIYAGFESILVIENNRKLNPEESYTQKYQKHLPCSYSYKLVYVDDKFSKSFMTYIGENAVYNFINNMIEESIYCYK